MRERFETTREYYAKMNIVDENNVKQRESDDNQMTKKCTFVAMQYFIKIESSIQYKLELFIYFLMKLKWNAAVKIRQPQQG